MAEALKDRFGMEVTREIGAMIRAVHRPFAVDRFVNDVARGYEGLELMSRGRHIA